MTTAQATLANAMQGPSTPVPAGSAPEVLLASTACAGSGNQTYAPKIINVSNARVLTLQIKYSPAAAGGRPSLVPVFSREVTQPASGDDDWYAMSVWDGTITGGVLGTIPAGADWSKQPDFGLALHRALAIVLEPADHADDEIRCEVSINLDGRKWMQLAYAEHGATGSPGTLAVKYALSI